MLCVHYSFKCIIPIHITIIFKDKSKNCDKPDSKEVIIYYSNILKKIIFIY